MPLRSRVGRLPGARAVAARLRESGRVRRIRATGLFDLEYWQRQRGREFATVSAAVRDFVREAEAIDGTFHPLIDAHWVAAHTRSGMFWIDALVDPAGRVTSTSPLFDVVAAGRGGPAGRSAAQVLRDHLRGAGDDAVLPVSEAYATGTTWGEARESAYRLAASVARQRGLAASREHAVWRQAAPGAPRERDAAASNTDAASDPVVAIVMPAYNREDSIAAAIASVQAQTVSGWRLVIVDDGSTDGTRSVIEGVLADGRIELLAGEHRGVSAARNTGIAAAGDAPFVAFLDADNEWMPDHLAALLAALRADPGLAMAYDALRVQEDGGVHYLGESGDYEQLRDGASFIDLNAVVIRASVLAELGAFDEGLRRWVDYELLLRILRGHRALFVPQLGVRYDHRRSRTDRITTSESRTWRDVILERHLLDWDAARRAERVPGRISVLMLGRRNWEWSLGTIRNLLDTADGADVEVLLVDNGGPASFSRLVTQAFEHDGRVTVIRLAREQGDSLKLDLALARSTGEFVLLFHHVAKVQLGWLGRLRDELLAHDAVAVQPLLRRVDGAILHAGALFLGDRQLPAPFLHGLALEDAARADRREATALSAGAMLLRAEDLLAVEGLSTALPLQLADAELCLRLAGRRPGGFRVLLDEVVTLQDAFPLLQPPARADRARFDELHGGRYPADESGELARIGMRSLGRAEDGRVDLPFGPVLLERTDRATVTRWAIKTAAPAAGRGDDWGDRFFADEIGRALTALGAVVSIDRREANLRETAHLDDVALVLRGAVPLEPVPGLVTILWVISHPDDVTDDELRRFTRAAAAGEAWAAARSASSGVPVLPLLQATDPEVFRPPAAGSPREGVVFVGSTRGEVRSVVAVAFEAGAEPTIWGRGWERTPLAGRVAGRSLPRDEVAGAYAHAAVVLNDHWPDMAANGFLSNRLFDAAATAARVLSDPVEGMAEVFGALVTPVTSADDVRRALETPSASESELRAIAARVAEQHSFARRAEQLIALAARAAEAASG